MFLSAAEFRNLDRGRLLEFLALGHEEGVQLEFKEALPGKSEKEAKWQMLKEIAGLANAHGGLLFLGVMEPSADLTAEDRALGIGDATAQAHNLERVCTAGIEPPVAGLEFKVIPVEGGDRAVVAIRVRESLNKPHLVTREGRREFYIRHTESVDPMTWFEIRESTLASATAEERARRRCSEVEDDIRLHFLPTLASGRLIMVQAVPILPPEQSWDVFDPRFREALIEVGLRGGQRPEEQPTLHGIRMGFSIGPEIPVTYEVHRRGGLVATGEVLLSERMGSRPTVQPSHRRLFAIFSEMANRVFGGISDDVPVLVRARCFNLRSTRFWVAHQGAYGSQKRPDFVLGEWLHQPGESFEEIAREQWVLLQHSFGLWAQED